MKISFQSHPLLLAVAATSLFGLSQGLSYSTSQASKSNQELKNVKLVDRFFAPYGPDLTADPAQSSDEIWEGYGFAMRACQRFAYDDQQEYVYCVSKQGYVSVLDYSSLPPTFTNSSLDLSGYEADIRDVQVCPEQGLLFLSLYETEHVLLYSTVKRDAPGKLENPITIAMDRPSALRVSPDCAKLAVVNAPEDTAWGVTLVSDFESGDGVSFQPVTFDAFDDETLLEAGVHMPLTLSALEYWDENSKLKDDIDWADLRANYNPNLFLKPSSLAFTEDASTLLVNFQQNSALARVNVATGDVESMQGYTLKGFTPTTSEDGIDILQDGGCDQMVTNPNLFAVRAPEGIDTVEIDGATYLVTADAGGSSPAFGSFEEKTTAGALLDGDSIAQTAFTASADFLDETKSFNSACLPDQGDWCAMDLEISLGSSAVDYTDSTAPILERIVAQGGRGISIFSVPDSSEDDMSLMWDSGSDFEAHGCANEGWAHNGIQDETFAPLFGAYYLLNPDKQDALDDANDPESGGCDDAGDGDPGACPISQTIDRTSLNDGPAVNSVVTIAACDRLYTIGCGKHNGNCIVYDITDIDQPVPVYGFNLSPSSENKSPGVAYQDRSLGDVLVESMMFVPPEKSLTGNPGFLVAGALSGTVSFFELECGDVETAPAGAVPTVAPPVASPTKSPTSGGGDPAAPTLPPIVQLVEDDLSSGAKAGIAIGVLVVVGIFLICCCRRCCRKKKNPSPYVMGDVQFAPAEIHVTDVEGIN